ncbi:hypothetical protein [Nocardioides pyridinolyticus]
MNTLLKTGTIGLASLVTAGMVAWQAPTALAQDDDPAATKRDDDSHVVVTTVDDDDDDDTGLKGTGTQTRTRTGAGDDNTGTNTNTRTRGDDGDDSRHRQVRDLTNDGPGRGNVDHSRHDTNDGTRHNTRG